jgi:hypothetical protein
MSTLYVPAAPGTHATVVSIDRHAPPCTSAEDAADALVRREQRAERLRLRANAASMRQNAAKVGLAHAAALARAFKRATVSQSAVEDWVSTSLLAQCFATAPAVAQADGKLVVMPSGPVDVIALVRVALASVRDAEAAHRQWQDHPGRAGARQLLGEW